MIFNDEHEALIREGNMRPQVACTYLLNGEWYVTTAFRESSAMVSSPPWYYETFVWKNDRDPEKVELVGDATGLGHIEACKRILKYGEWREEVL